MNKYIQIKKIRDMLLELNSRVWLERDTVIAILKGMANLPRIDIVHCGECVKANTEDCSHSYWDDDWDEWRVGYKGDDWFCADGEGIEE